MTSGAHRDRDEPRTRRYEPDAIYVSAERLKRQGVEFRKSPGPWRPIRVALRRPGRNAERSIPIVTNGMVEIAVDRASAQGSWSP